MSKRIILMSNYRLTEVMKNNIPLDLQNEVNIINARFDKVLPISRKLIENNKVDVIIARDSHVYILKEYFNDSIPLIEINISISDMLNLINNNPDDKIAIVNYKEPINELYFNLLKNPPGQIVFDSIHDLRKKMKSLKQEGYNSIIGTSAVCDVAENYGLKPLFIYSNKAVIDAIEQAKKIIDVQSVENERKNQLRAIIDYVYSGIIYVDKNGAIDFFNPIAEKILDISSKEAKGKHIERILPNSRYDQVIKARNPEINQYTKINNNVVLVSRIPIIVKEKINGVLITFQDIEEIKKSELKIRKKSFEKGLTAKYTFNDIIGETEVMKRRKAIARAYARSDENILIRGETGTGKEIFAQSIHNFSERSDKPFVALNCAALPPTLLESELFGYDKGAFTGARKEGKPGKFELAHEGTIFLDEIGKMPTSLQPKILRVIEEKEIMRIGGEQIIPVDVRIISSTNKNLLEEVKNSNFQKDLYYRLNTFNLSLPPLKERKSDILLLAKYLLTDYDQQSYQTNQQTWDKIFELMKEVKWEGNVRELKNIIKRINIFLDNGFDQGVTVPEILNKSLDNPVFEGNVGKVDQEEFERKRILKVLKEEKWNRERTAVRLNMSRTTLWRKMKELNI